MIGDGIASAPTPIYPFPTWPMNPQRYKPLRSILSITLFIILSLGVAALSLNLLLALAHRWL